APELVGGSSLPILLLVLGLGGFALAYLLVGPGSRKGPKRHGDIPLAMRPYHSDAELEGPGLERAMSWGVAFAVFSALFLPLYWIIEPGRINDRVEDFYEADVARGRSLYQNACASCHGVNLEGGSAPHPDPTVTAAWPAPTLHNIVARYQDSAVVDDVRDHILLTLRYGRTGTPMQAFSIGNGGALSDFQLEAIAAYILSVQTGELPQATSFVGRSREDVFAANCARCHGEDAQGYVGPQLQNVFERYGWTGGDDASLEVARAAVRQAIVNGRIVPGQAPMPSFTGVLTDEAIDAVVDHLLSIQRLGGPSYGQIGGDPVAAPDEE
ncbi:MAG: c-type cytochrome, partial [Nitriliruptoraceae bacterium]